MDDIFVTPGPMEEDTLRKEASKYIIIVKNFLIISFTNDPMHFCHPRFPVVLSFLLYYTL
jgi:hypothetical protein